MKPIIYPTSVQLVFNALYSEGYEGYLVGGCVRDSILGRRPKDWDVATDCRPEEMMRIFKKFGFTVIPTGIKFGTISVKINETTAPIEITTYRTDIEYPDGSRHPVVEYADTLEDDLMRRDFTINAMAYDPANQELVDPFNGQKDLGGKLVKAVGNAETRFKEDALRMLRAIRFAGVLDFHIDADTAKAIVNHAHLIKKVSAERIHEEITKILLVPNPEEAITYLHGLGLLYYIIPELIEGQGMTQCGSHQHTVLGHNLRACIAVKPEKHLRWAALLHDVGKPRSMTDDPESGRHFYGHQMVSARLASHILKRLKFSNDERKRIVTLIENHMFVYDPDSKPSVARRLLNRVGLEAVYDLVELRKADRSATCPDRDGTIGSHADRLLRVIKEILEAEQAFKVSDMAIDGRDIMELLDVKPGKAIGEVKKKLFELVLENPELNTREQLLSLAKSIHSDMQGCA